MTREGGQGFLVIPAVDVLSEEAVRLEQGDFRRVSIRAGTPEALVSRFARAHPPLIHVVDLDGARTGAIQPELVSRLVEAARGVPVQAAGGIRSLADAETLLAAGATRAVIGTAAFAEPDRLLRYAATLGDRLVVAVDARAGLVALGGWERSSELTAEDAAERCAEAGVGRLLCTAIERDGTLAGPDLRLLERVAARFRGPVLAAGGIRSVEDLRRLEALGLEGAIVGRALVEGRIPLSAVARRAGGSSDAGWAGRGIGHGP